MDANKYQLKAMRTAPFLSKPDSHLTLPALGLVGEAGEIADHIKKHLFHDHEFDTTYIVDELGDILWYIALLCSVCQVELGDVMARNIEKLEARYPDGFDPEKSQNREEYNS